MKVVCGSAIQYRGSKLPSFSHLVFQLRDSERSMSCPDKLGRECLKKHYRQRLGSKGSPIGNGTLQVTLSRNCHIYVTEIQDA